MMEGKEMGREGGKKEGREKEKRGKGRRNGGRTEENASLK
jgi:hypothetical protein